MDTNDELKNLIAQRIANLPKPVQDAFATVPKEKILRELAIKYRLHIDDGELFENEVMLTLLAVHQIEDLEKHFHEDINLPSETAGLLAGDVVMSIFEPIREELERQLEHPQAKEKEISSMDAMRTERLGTAQPNLVVEPAPGAPASIAAAAPIAPPAKPEPPKVIRAAISEIYKPGVPSTARKAAEGDPYREPVV